MTQLKVLISGGGIGGPALAFWLARAGHDVTIIERLPFLRASGAQIDLRAQGIEVVKRMGLIDAVRSKVVDEDGVRWVTSKGTTVASFMANKTGKGVQSLTSEFEIMRGDLVQLLYDATKDKVKYLFDKTIDHFKQDDSGVTAYFSDGESDRFDLLVGADGQGSRVRKAILPSDAPDPATHFGLFSAYWYYPRTERDLNMFTWYTAGKGRNVMSRSHSPTQSQAYFVVKDDTVEAKKLMRAPVDEQKAWFIQKYQGAGWETDRFIEGMKTTENFYCHEIVQIRTDTWRKGRVVLLGDAAHAPSPITGMGTTSAFVGAYVLAGEICRNENDPAAALASYEKVHRPFIDQCQKLNRTLVRNVYPTTRFGVAVLYIITAIVSFLRIPYLVARFSKEENGGWQLPEYPELNQKP